MPGIITSGIQKKYLLYMTVLLILALLLSSLGVWFYAQKNMTQSITEKSEFMTEKIGLSLDSLYEKSEEVTADCILDDKVQKSLRKQPLDAVEKGTLGKYFAYTDLKQATDYCYVDNKQNVYTRSYSQISYTTFKETGFAEKLGTEYSKTKWFWTEDTLFGTGKMALFVGRYVHSMEYAHEPGMLFFKMSEDFFSQAVGGEDTIKAEAVTGIIDESGQTCALWSIDNYSMKEDTLESIRALAQENTTGMIRQGHRIPGGVLSAWRQEGSKMIAYTFIPDYVLTKGLTQLLLVLAGIYLLVFAIAVILSIYVSKHFTSPIQKITEAMAGFDGNDFSKTIEVHTNTELDLIGSYYNRMLGNIEKLLYEIKEQEKALRTSELNMLISQINPHFLYNTLDTIYMLARINKEETTMRMIQALSKYLRLSLSKGNDIVTLEDELENVRSYMEIQQIRNQNLFTYQLDCPVNTQQFPVLKLILQPLVENAIKYGFGDIFEGGIIRICSREDESYLTLSVANNGTPIKPAMVKRLNGLALAPVAEMKNYFPDKKHGYGVVNIATRLRLKYGEDVSFYYEISGAKATPLTDGQKEPLGTALEGWTNCVIKIPKEGAKANEKEKI